MTIVVCIIVATGLALIAAISMLLGGQTAPSLRGWGLGRLLAFYLIAGCVSSALIGLGLAVLPTRRLTSAFLGAVLGAGLYLVYLWLDPNHSLNSPGQLPGIALTALALGVPGGLIVHSVMKGMDAHIGS